MNISIKNQKGFTFVELTVVVALLLIVTTLVTVLVHPLDQLKKGRDNQRLSDINLLDRAINEYLLDNSRYPDQINVLKRWARSKNMWLRRASVVSLIGLTPLLRALTK